MSCLHPILIKFTNANWESSYHTVNCRECEECANLLRNSAFIRLKYEYENCMKQGGLCFFFTLTFEDEYVPFKFHRMCFDKVLIQRWLQSFRQKFRRHYGWSVKYFIVSELGHVGTKRPHHHGVLFLYPDKKYQLKSWQSGGIHADEIPWFPESYCSIIRHLWTFGRSDVQVLDPNKGGFRYVSKYMAKDVSEQNLFKDIITRIQMKRGKGQYGESKNHLLYLEKTFPSLYAFKNRYCPFTMISKSLGATAPITDKMIEESGLISIDGFDYSIPRYYVDRYVRRECLAELPKFSCNSHCSDVNFARVTMVPNRFRKVYDPTKKNVVISKGLIPIDAGDVHVLPPKRILDKYKVYDDLFSFHYENVPHYKLQYSYDGTQRFIRAVPKQSEVSQLPLKRLRYQITHLADIIEDKYYSLPPILQNSCHYDIPKILHDSADLLRSLRDSSPDFIVIPDTLFYDVMLHLNDLSQVHSEWRAKARLADMERKRNEKIIMNQRHCKAQLTWEEYKSKSKYFKLF